MPEILGTTEPATTAPEQALELSGSSGNTDGKGDNTSGKGGSSAKGGNTSDAGSASDDGDTGNTGPTACEDQADCESNETCVDGESCTEDDQCAHTCLDGECAPRSGLGGLCDLSGADEADSTDCKEPLECTDGFCLLPDGVTQDGEFCIDNADCINTCVKHRCATSGFGEACDDTADCGEDNECAGTVCKRSRLSVCTDDAECESENCKCSDPGCSTRVCKHENAACGCRYTGPWDASCSEDSPPLDAYVQYQWCDGDTMCNGHGDCVVVPELAHCSQDCFRSFRNINVDDFGGPQKYCIAYPNPSFPCPDGYWANGDCPGSLEAPYCIAPSTCSCELL